ncbi:MAG: AraC family transcriptional regulator [Anaerolineae bacterium]
MELRAANIIDVEIEGHYGFFPFVEHISTRLHYHDFFEIFLISKGNIAHHINGKVILLSAGHLVFIRPADAHCFKQHENQDCELLNIAFLQNTCISVFDFLNREICDNVLLSPDLPSTTLVSQQNIKSVVRQLEQWGRNLYRDKQQSHLTLKGLLANLLSNYFLTQSPSQDDAIPAWLQMVCNEMQDRANIIEGRDALLRLANRTPEYIGRSFKQYLNMTPSQFLNNLRLDYAADLLLHTNQSPTDICFEVGFGNLSHFYHLFKDRWQCSPNQYRKQHQQALIP